jgi:hypothetical protein
MANAYEASHRYRAEQKFTELFESELMMAKSFENDFRELKWVSIKKASDQSFRIITWQLKHSDGIYTYKGWIQMKEGSIIKLTDNAQEMGDISFETQTSDDWFGALYYNMIEKGEGQNKYYLLFGYNGWNDRTHKKIIDVLHFKNGNPTFGKAIFSQMDKIEGTRYRTKILLEFDATANVNCNFNSDLNLIVHDFITTTEAYGSIGEPKKIPDGTYVAYEDKGDFWHKIDMLEISTQSEKDIYYKPKADDEKGTRDIFGKSKKKNKP